MLDTLELDKYIKNLSDLPMLFNHFGRYFYAMKKLNINKNDVVVDASCGQGYGAYNIMLKSSMTFGLDINEKYIKYANDHFKFERLYFLTYNEFYKLGQRAHKVICLETIEHIEKNKIEEFLENLIKILISNGEIIISFPIGNNTQSEYNNYHVCEPSIDFIYNILKKNLIKVNYEIDTFINSYGHKTDYCFCWGIK
jgi:2-polyprenyl-3-methyl-5-hydroxy-6-metoxy-1,4-benzoquinol methylase